MKRPLVIVADSSGSILLPDAVCPDGHSLSRKRGEGRDAVCVRQRRATEAYEWYNPRSDEAGGRKMRQRCEQLPNFILCNIGNCILKSV